MTQVTVLAGGASDEREISLRSGAAVATALQKGGYHVQAIDPADGLDKQLATLQAGGIIFPALHGLGGEDGTLQRFLEQHHIPYIGADSRASALCFDKARYTALLAKHHILVPQTELVDLQHYQQSVLRQRPFVLKPNDGGSSIDTVIVRDPAAVDEAAIEEVFSRHGKLLLQALITGIEITVAVLGTNPLPVIEIIPPPSAEFDYENKYNGQTQELCPPTHVDQMLQNQAQALAQQIHELTGCRDMSRTDIIVTSAGELYVLETNTIPGLTDQSLLPKAAAAGGYDMTAVCDQLVQAALGRT
jgi:D-alanine-D-alanine ligase